MMEILLQITKAGREVVVISQDMLHQHIKSLAFYYTFLIKN